MLTIRIVDVVSVEGFMLSIRHRIRKYPAVIIDHDKRQLDWDFKELDDLIETRLSSKARDTGRTSLRVPVPRELVTAPWRPFLHDTA